MNQLLGGDSEESYYMVGKEWSQYWHIDGFPDAIRGLKTGEVKNFTCLLGILLSEVPDDLYGNLVSDSL